MKIYKIDNILEGQSLIRYLSKILPKANISFLYKMLRKKNILLNDKKALGNEVLNNEDIIKIFFSDETFNKFSKEIKNSNYYLSLGTKNKNSNFYDRYFNILYEDTDIIILDKRVNVLSQKAKKDDISVNELLIKYLLENDKIKESNLKVFKPSIINRLDRNTSGIMLFGKTLKGLNTGRKLISNRKLYKSYICVVKGRYTKEGIIKGYILKDEKCNKSLFFDYNIKGSKYMEEEIKVIKETFNYSILKVILHTGRSHQIRCSLSYMNYPIALDNKYGDKKWNKYLAQKGIKYQLLHSFEIIYKGKKIKAPIPDRFNGFLDGIDYGNMEF